jgi:hypothetical protein
VSTPEQDRLAEIKQRAAEKPPATSSRELAAYVARSLVDRDWLLAEVDRLRREFRELDLALGDTIDSRDRAEDFADRLAAAIAPRDVVGEHSSGNNPWFNALQWAEEQALALPAKDGAR